MIRLLLILACALFLTDCSQTYYVVRHAEKVANADSAAMMGNDLPLSQAGMRRAEALKEALKNKNIRSIFSTNTLRTKSTAEPLRAYLGLTTEIYNAKLDPAFIESLKKTQNNTLIIGHSNTVRGIVNGLCGTNGLTQDLGDNEYDNLFVVKYRHFPGTRVKFIRLKYGVKAVDIR